MLGTLVSSNWLVLYGPFGSWKTVPFGIQGEISIAEVRSPRRRKSNRLAQGVGEGAGAAGAGTPGFHSSTVIASAAFHGRCVGATEHTQLLRPTEWNEM